jgi:hypothetical protein
MLSLTGTGLRRTRALGGALLLALVLAFSMAGRANAESWSTSTWLGPHAFAQATGYDSDFWWILLGNQSSGDWICAEVASSLPWQCGSYINDFGNWPGVGYVYNPNNVSQFVYFSFSG